MYPGKTIYQLHMGFTDITKQTHHFDEQTFVPALGRVGMGKKGAHAFFGANKLIQKDSNRYDLHMEHHNQKIHLHLYDQKGPVMHGKGGEVKINKKGSTFYYSHPRLAVEGRLDMLDTAESTQFVHGSAWLDHQWGDFLTHQPFLYWTWIAVQLDNNEELMIFEFFDENGAPQGQSATWFDKNKKSRAVKAKIVPTQNWVSTKTKVEYPIDYEIKVPALKLHLKLAADMFDQEMHSSWFSYWEGAATVTGTHGDRQITGKGFLEQTGFKGLTKRGRKNRLAS